MEQEFNKAVEEFQAGQYKQAEKILLKINKRQPDIPDVVHMLAYIAMETDRPKIAAKYLCQIVESVPPDAGLFNLLGCARRKEGKVDDAIEAFSKAVSLRLSWLMRGSIWQLPCTRLSVLKKRRLNSGVRWN